MVANLILKGDNYYCSNCMVKQSGIPPHCNFCGYQFSNWEEVAYKEVMKEVEEAYQDGEFIPDDIAFLDYMRR